MNSVQEILDYILKRFQELNYRLYEGECYKQIGKTHAWKFAIRLSDFSHKIMFQEQCFKKITRSILLKRTLEFIDKTPENNTFPKLLKDRHIFSFRNGVYFTKTDKFYKYGEEPQEDFVSAKYYDFDFINFDTDDWYKIPTPNFQKFFEFHYANEDTCRLAYKLIGRLLFDVDEIENWQILPVLYGIAGSGTGTLVNTLCNLYEAQDVGFYEANCKLFQLQGIYDKFFYIAINTTATSNINKEMFQKMISGEEVAVSRLFRPPIITTWKPPGIMYTNTPCITPIDSSVVLNHTKKAPENLVDPKEMENELGALIKKCVLSLK